MHQGEGRHRVRAGLNKGEVRNALARVVFFSQLGETRDRNFERQRYRASGLTLVTAATVLWNTVHLAHRALLRPDPVAEAAAELRVAVVVVRVTLAVLLSEKQARHALSLQLVQKGREVGSDERGGAPRRRGGEQEGREVTLAELGRQRRAEPGGRRAIEVVADGAVGDALSILAKLERSSKAISGTAR